MLQTSRGGHDTAKIVDSIQDRGINQVRIPIRCCLSSMTAKAPELVSEIICRLVMCIVVYVCILLLIRILRSAGHLDECSLFYASYDF